MLDLLNKPNKSEQYSVILNNYIKNQSYQNRIQILLEKQMIQKVDHSLFKLTKKGRGYAAKLNSIQRIFSIKASG